MPFLMLFNQFYSVSFFLEKNSRCHLCLSSYKMVMHQLRQENKFCNLFCKENTTTNCLLQPFFTEQTNAYSVEARRS